MKKVSILIFCVVFSIFFCSCNTKENNIDTENKQPQKTFNFDDIPEYTDTPYYVIDDNIPEFTDDEITTNSFERYSNLDNLGRCGVTFACVGKDIMPTEERGAIGQIKPTGWHTVKYDFVDGKYLYNRCHLIGFQLTGENANEKNLITGTRYFNVEGMLPFEDMVADYVRETENHVMYRVTPIFIDDELVARGVRMEGLSVEDNGDGVCFDVFVYNVQPNVTINYANGESVAKVLAESQNTPSQNDTYYILNTNSKKFHKNDCRLANDILEHNKKISNQDRQSIINEEYAPCKVCNP